MLHRCYSVLFMRLHENKGWMRPLLVVAGIYNILWGGAVLSFPLLPLGLSGIQLPLQQMFVQIIGIITLVFGIGYVVASLNPFRHWVIILVGLLGKMFGVIIFLFYFFKGALPLQAGLIVLTNDIIWLAPFSIILYGAFEYNRRFSEQLNYFYSSRTNVRGLPILTNKGASLTLLSGQQPVLLVFLRHFGCTFCREALNKLSKERSTIEALGTKIILVHMVDEKTAEERTARYGLNDLNRISDSDCLLYDAFALEKGGFKQLFGLKVLFRGFIAGILGKNYIGAPQGDYTQMPGVFLLYKGDVVKAYRHHTAADTPDYIVLANCEKCL